MNFPLKISVVFATKNRLSWLKKTMDSLYAELEGNFNYEIIVVDGQSNDGTVPFLKSCRHLQLIEEEKLRGCCFAYDTALRAARGEWVCWLNDDIKIIPGAFVKMMDFVHDPQYHKVGMTAFLASHLHDFQDTFVVHNCFGLPLVYADFGFLRRELLKEVGYLDLNYHKYHWDSDLALKIWATGKYVIPCPDARIIHYFLEDEVRQLGEESRNNDFLYFREKWIVQAQKMASAIYQNDSLFADTTRFLEQTAAARVLKNSPRSTVHET